MFDIGSQCTVHGIVHREVTGPTKHLRELVLSSLRGLRQVADSNRDPNSDRKKQMQASKTEAVLVSFKVWIPESIVILLLVHSESVIDCPSRPVATNRDLDGHISTLRTLFTMHEIDAAALASIIQTRVQPERSSGAMLKVVGAFVRAISNAGDKKTTELLLHHYINVFSYFPPPISERAYGPLRRAIEQDTAERAVADGSGAKVVVVS
jgi:hypothetical protein